MPDQGPTGQRWRLALLVIAFACFGLPAALHTAGLQPDYERGGLDLEDRLALRVATNQSVLGEWGDPTGCGSPR